MLMEGGMWFSGRASACPRPWIILKQCASPHIHMYTHTHTHIHMYTLPHFEYMPTVFQTSTLNKGSSPVYFCRRKCMNRMGRWVGGWGEPERTDVP